MHELIVGLNADVGEGCGSDSELLSVVSSANVACGWHAGDAATMLRTVRRALELGVAVGAHPSYPDRANFGRTEMQRDPELVYADVLYQIGALAALVHAQGGRLAHLKAHGALYNQAAMDPALADAVVRAVRDFDPDLALFALAGSAMVTAARDAGLTVKQEVFADRGYNPDGSLVPRGMPGALHDDEDVAPGQTLQMVCAVDGSFVPICADTVCVHGDGPHALAFARSIRERLEADGSTIRA